MTSAGRELGELGLDGIGWATTEAFDDGRALFTAVCELGFEGVVAKNHSSLYRPNDRGWVKVKNPNYWRRDCRARGDEPEARASGANSHLAQSGFVSKATFSTSRCSSCGFESPTVSIGPPRLRPK